MTSNNTRPAPPPPQSGNVAARIAALRELADAYNHAEDYPDLDVVMAAGLACAAAAEELAEDLAAFRAHLGVGPGTQVGDLTDYEGYSMDMMVQGGVLNYRLHGDHIHLDTAAGGHPVALSAAEARDAGRSLLAAAALARRAGAGS
jgi:hypothetical protein